MCITYGTITTVNKETKPCTILNSKNRTKATAARIIDTFLPSTITKSKKSRDMETGSACGRDTNLITIDSVNTTNAENAAASGLSYTTRASRNVIKGCRSIKLPGTINSEVCRSAQLLTTASPVRLT